jgi:hypothetical protein
MDKATFQFGTLVQAKRYAETLRATEPEPPLWRYEVRPKFPGTAEEAADAATLGVLRITLRDTQAKLLTLVEASHKVATWPSSFADWQAFYDAVNAAGHPYGVHVGDEAVEAKPEGETGPFHECAKCHQALVPGRTPGTWEFAIDRSVEGAAVCVYCWKKKADELEARARGAIRGTHALLDYVDPDSPGDEALDTRVSRVVTRLQAAEAELETAQKLVASQAAHIASYERMRASHHASHMAFLTEVAEAAREVDHTFKLGCGDVAHTPIAELKPYGVRVLKAIGDHAADLRIELDMLVAAVLAVEAGGSPAAPHNVDPEWPIHPAIVALCKMATKLKNLIDERARGYLTAERVAVKGDSAHIHALREAYEKQTPVLIVGWHDEWSARGPEHKLKVELFKPEQTRVEQDSYARRCLDTEVAAVDAKFGKFASMHEAYGVLEEERDELFEAVRLKQSNPERGPRIFKEAIQVAATALRMAEQVQLSTPEGTLEDFVPKNTGCCVFIDSDVEPAAMRGKEIEL